MTEQRSDHSGRELEQALRSLGDRVAYPPTPDLATSTRRRLEAGKSSTRLWGTRHLPRLVSVLAALVLILTVLVLFPGVREALAERLGLPGISISFVPPVPTPTPTSTPPPTPLPTPTPVPVGPLLHLGERTTLARAQERISFRLLTPTLTSLGPPDEVYFGAPPAGGQVALVYRPRPGMPEADSTGVGLLVTEFQGDVRSDVAPVGKMLGPDTRLEMLTVSGGEGYWIEGAPHLFLYQDVNGQIQQETIRLASNTLLWQQGTVTVRIESGLDREAALRVAESMR